MRINVETFLALTVLLGTGVAVGVGVTTLRQRNDAASPADAAAVEGAKAPAAASAPVVSAPVVSAPVVSAPVVPVPVVPAVSVPVDPPMPEVLEPEPDPSTIPGPMVES